MGTSNFTPLDSDIQVRLREAGGPSQHNKPRQGFQSTS